ncbi:MAG: hypothetical protein NTV70_22400 [Acidobacteria bacterium]|nr:hypothetical protein [Acidobacteriota bacterium]
MKNITLSADEALIQHARDRAARDGSTINTEFRKWLVEYTKGEDRVAAYDALMKELSYVRIGRKFTRDEMNER